ncbi:transaldolase [Actinomycetospora termitidis]|uniref:Transaldolase n=1 Tax=Actinomycetospora termitidis TaxID=3053470 RepID=A0ABT7MBK8_9PSEU|nr:transaldolase [Actinomycetospora sp. Odt1-22]MDL5158028.1 transaldolase [Actinomycetospora sp. Odt1-22]
MSTPLADLSAAGVSIWLDDLSRQRIESGNLRELIEQKHVVGVTSNPTIFASALSDADHYAEQLDDLARRGASVDDAVREITTDDVRRACDVFRGVFSETDAVDGRVSLEVDPRSAHDTEKTVGEALDLWKTVDRPNLMIKIPATPEGLPAITRVLAEGVSVNVTLIFSVDRYRAVMDAYLAGMEQARANGHDLSVMASVASFFVSRVDSEVDKRLDAIGTDAALALRGTAAVANARLAYQAWLEAFSTERWATLKGAGAKAQRPLWASTGVKNKAYPDTLYVTELAAPDTVNTMPEATLDAFADHGDLHGDAVTGTADAAGEVFAALAGVGIDVDDVYQVLEDEGVDKFEKSWQELLETVSEQLTRRSPEQS